MKDNFEKFLPVVLKSEGGYDNRPSNEDPGGETNWGIIADDIRTYYGRDPKKDEIKNLTKETAFAIYKKLYWDKVKADDLPSGIDVCVFDHGLLAGNGTAIKLLQNVIGAISDGIIGNQTFTKIENYIKINGIEKLIDEYADAREIYLKKLKNFKYNPGWISRVERVRKFAKTL